MMSISLEDYFGPWATSVDATVERIDNAERLLEKVNTLLAAAESDGVPVRVNPNTNSRVSGEKYGGFRPQDCPQGAPHSSHKDGCGVDVFDPINELDMWLTDDKLEKFGLYREAPTATPHWCHLTDRAPHSGRRTFLP